jgi:hypothetical protein
VFGADATIGRVAARLAVTQMRHARHAHSGAISRASWGLTVELTAFLRRRPEDLHIEERLMRKFLMLLVIALSVPAAAATQDQTTAPPFYAQTGAEIAASVIPNATSFVPGDVRRYGADPTGTVDSSAAWQAAINQASQSGGGEVTGVGTYLIGTGLVIATTGVKIRGGGMGGTQLKANANGIAILKVAASYVSVEDILFDGNGKTSVDCLAVAPANEADTTHASQVNLGTYRGLLLQNCDNGIRMRAGPTVVGSDSGCFFNSFIGAVLLNDTRAIWMQNSVHNGRGGPDRNVFMGVTIDNFNAVTNTGLQIDNGATNTFLGFSVNGVNVGIYPNATPSAVIIANMNSAGGNNNDNHFFGSQLEFNTRDLDNSNTSTVILGGDWTASKFACGAGISRITNNDTMANVTTAAKHGLATGMRVRMAGQTPSAYSGVFSITVTGQTSFIYTMLSNPGGSASVVGTYDVPPRLLLGIDPSTAPNIVPGLLYSEGIAGYPSGYWGMTKEIADANLNWQAYALSSRNVTNTTSLVSAASDFRQLGNMVEWHFTFAFRASVAGTELDITPPVAANTALYRTLSPQNPFYTLTVADGTGTNKQVEAGWTHTGKFYVRAPNGGWNTVDNKNAVYVAISYHL